MQNTKTHKVLSANDLLVGDVVYLDPHHRWSRKFTDALIFSDQALADQALKQAANQQDTVLGPYLVDVNTNAKTPDHFREVFRMTGPSNRFHGKQAV